MATKQNGRFYAGTVIYADGTRDDPGTELPDIRPSTVRLDCKYCYTDQVATVESHEYFRGHTMQLLCDNCGAGLTSCEPVTI